MLNRTVSDLATALVSAAIIGAVMHALGAATPLAVVAAVVVAAGLGTLFLAYRRRLAGLQTGPRLYIFSLDDDETPYRAGNAA